MMRWLTMLGAVLSVALAQQPAPSPQTQLEAEQQSLRESLAEAGSSKVDFLRAIERHLEKFPNTTQRAELERAALASAMEMRDGKRIVKYGERVLQRDPNNVEALERVARYLLIDDNDKAAAARSASYARRLEEIVRAQPKSDAPGVSAARAAEEQHILLSKALVYQARAVGNLGKNAEAEKLARQSFDIFPSAEAAREISRWAERQGKTEEAIRSLAEAFTIPDPNVEDEDRAKDRARMGEWYRKLKGAEVGLGDIVLSAYDSARARVETYKADLKKLDPNVGRMDFMDYTVTGLAGEKLHLATLKGKVLVLDFWATWCGPCRAQQPLYEQVKERFKTNKDVIFLNINTDQNKSLVKPFLDQQKWNKNVYFEDGLSSLLRISSIPMTLVVNRRGEVGSRMNGYIADKFVDMLSERIEDALKEN